jgi:hypothetical protein
MLDSRKVRPEIWQAHRDAAVSDRDKISRLDTHSGAKLRKSACESVRLPHGRCAEKIIQDDLAPRTQSPVCCVEGI